jgi:hypothetical protein
MERRLRELQKEIAENYSISASTYMFLRPEWRETIKKWREVSDEQEK